MQTPIPFGLYAEVYDLIYHDKDYSAEARFIADLIRGFAREPGSRPHVLDLACGTGRHAIELAALGFDVAGSDISASMLDVARNAARASGQSIPFYQESFQSSGRIDGQFDAVLAMFASLGYLLDPAELTLALEGIRKLLVPGGLFIFDVWNGLAVLRDFSPVRVKRAKGGATEVIRISRTSLDEIQQVAHVEFEFVVLRNGVETVQFSEEHHVRFFFPREIGEILSRSGFALAAQCPFLEPSRALGPRDWNATFVARRS